MPDQALNLVRLQQAGNSARQLPHDRRTPFLHRRKIQFKAAGLDAVFLEFMLSAMKQFR